MNTWKKVKIGDICKIVKGATGIASAEPGEYPLVCTSVERKTCSTFQFDCEAVCIPLVSSSGHGKKSLNNVHYQKGKFALGTILCAVIPNNPQEVSAGYLHQYLQFYKDSLLVPLMHGAANVSLSMRDIATIEIPLPDFKTQSKLVKMFVEMQNKLKEINTEFVKQKTYAKQLRQNILQEAIEGKLTAEWRKNHPMIKGDPDFDADALFEEIVAGKASSPSFAKGKTSKPLPPITDKEKPFEIPAGWKWVRLGEIGTFNRGGGFLKRDFITEGFPCIHYGQIHMKLTTLTYSHLTCISYELAKKSKLASTGDIILAITSEDVIGSCKCIAWLGKYNVAIGSHTAIFKHSINSIFLSRFFQTPFFNKNKQKYTHGSKVVEIKPDDIAKIKIPLPPLAEQEEIVNRVEKLLNNVVELEQQISQREEYAKKLMQSVLRDAFAGK